MTERSYRTVDKSAWGDGPWADEPDKLQWVDEATGLDCLIVRGPLGALCGYVGVPPEHPWHGRGHHETDSGGRGWEDDDASHETRPDMIVEAHGGLTYSDGCQEGRPEEEGICHVPAPGRPKDVWWFGFDCAHSGDVVPHLDRPTPFGHESYKGIDYVRRECASLATQLNERSA